VEVKLHSFSTSALDEASGQLHSQAGLPLVKKRVLRTEQGARWARESVWTFGTKKKLTSTEIQIINHKNHIIYKTLMINELCKNIQRL